MKTLGIVMAKSQSRRAPNKNIADICGRPLMAYPIESLRESGICNRIIISTDSREYGDIGVEHGADEYVLRDAWSDNFIQMSVTADDARRKYEERTGISYDETVVCGANVIFLRPSWFRAARRILREFAYKSMPIDVVGIEPYNWGVNVCRVRRGIMYAPHFYVLKHVGIFMEMDWPHELDLARQLVSSIQNGDIDYPLDEKVHEMVLAHRNQQPNRMRDLTPIKELTECKTITTNGQWDWC